MYSLSKPSNEHIQQFIAEQQRCAFSYAEVGATRQTPPARYTIDHNRIQLGSGAAKFEQAKAAICRWEMFKFSWVQLCWPNTPIKAGATVAVLARILGIWSLNACRIVYVIEEAGDVERFGFSYGTLPYHVERGEERFSVEWRHTDDSVWYDILAFSRPNQFLAKAGKPYVRHLQKQFAKDSMQAMLNATR
jgi:uncharacterized protein (UPF0548 family)